MLRSMTGFGRCVMEDADWTQTWEIRSVNNRLRFDAAQASAMLDQVAALADLHGDAFEPDYNALFAIPTLWERESGDGDDEMEERLEEGLIAALEDWNESRETEGAALARDMASRIAQMEEWVSRIDERELVDVIKKALPAKVLNKKGHPAKQTFQALRIAVNGELEESRFLQEMVVLSDKLDVSEELTRLHAHLERLRDLLEIGADAGRRLDFTLQECFREIATCGNKIQDAQTSRLVVDFKNELEKCREQVQNLE